MKIKVELLIIIILAIILILLYLKDNGNIGNGNLGNGNNSISKSNPLSTTATIDAEAYIQNLEYNSLAAGNDFYIDNRKPNLFNKITYSGKSITEVSDIGLKYATFANQIETTFLKQRAAMKSSFLKYGLDIALRSGFVEDTVDKEYFALPNDQGGICMSVNIISVYNDEDNVEKFGVLNEPEIKLSIYCIDKSINRIVKFDTQATQDNQIVWKIHPDINDVTDMYGVSKDNKLYLGKIHIGDSLDRTVTWDLVTDTFNGNTTGFKYIYNDIDLGVIHVVGVDGNVYSFNTYADIINQKQGNVVIDTGDIISLYKISISPELFIVKTDRKLWYVERYDNYFSGNETPRCIADYILNQNLVKPIYRDEDKNIGYPPIQDNIVMFEMVSYYTQGAIFCIEEGFRNIYSYTLYIG